MVRFVTPSALPHGPTLSSTESHLHRIESAGVTVSAGKVKSVGITLEGNSD